MKLPGVDRAVLDPAKIRDYILSPSHPIGRFKARFFSSLGYDQSEWRVLAADLRQHANGVVTEGEISRYGQKFEVRGSIVGPNGRSAAVAAVWMVRTGEDFPRFITAYPD